jgi:isoquinoline 1-oxidoreductase alpha subunit
MITLHINGNNHQVEADQDELLVWVLHEKLGLTKTRFGCGIEMCGACTVLVDGRPRRSCIIPVAEVIGRKIITREGLTEEISLRETV